MKSTIHEATRKRTKKLVFRDAWCDFVDRPLPSKQKNFKMTHYSLRSSVVLCVSVVKYVS